MVRWVSLLAVLTAASVAPAAEPTKVSQHWAVLIGVDDYAYANDLQYCGADQFALFEQLKKSGFPEENVFILHTKATDVRYQPSRTNIEHQLNVVLKLAEERDLLVVGFSGHGVHLDGKSYLCPADADLEDPASLISLDGVYDRLNACAAPFKLVVVDACRNDPRPGGKRSLEATDGTRALAKSLHEMELPKGVVLLNSCAPGEVSWEEAQFGHGVFMHYVLEALKGGADTSGDRSVSLNELGEFVSPKTKAYVARQFGQTQRPFFKGELSIEAMSYALLPVTPEVIVPPPAVAPFDAATAKLHQEAWAKYLKQDVEIANSIGMKFRLIPAGEFLMGADEDALRVLQRFNYLGPDDISDDYPLHRVRLAKPYYLGAHGVALGQFLSFYHDAKYQLESERDGKGGYGWTGSKFEQRRSYVPWDWGFRDQTMDHPVVNVTWNDATAFCEWLGRKEGRTYRLPTEAEWEFACKAGTTTRFWFGDNPEELARNTNGADQSQRGIWRDPSTLVVAVYENGRATNSKTPFPFLQGNDGYAFSAPPGRFPPNPFGLGDILGNVGEWCHDWYGERYYGASPTEDPQGPTAGSQRVHRGGGFAYSPARCRSSNRDRLAPSARELDLGFRVVLVP